MKIIVVDDDTVYSHPGVVNLLKRIGHAEDAVVPLTRPQDLATELDRHPDTALVLVDMNFLNTSRTGLTALRLLADRDGPPAVGFSAPEDDRLLYPYAACQLLKRPPVGWVLKNVFDQAELERIVRQIAEGSTPDPSMTLRQFLPSHQLTGKLVQSLLQDQIDLTIWRMMSTRLHKDDEVARKIFMHKKSVRNRYLRYRKAIEKLQLALSEMSRSGRASDGYMPHRWLEEWDPAGPDSAKLSGMIGTFARLNRGFFKAPELDELVPQ
ncbi:response regulator transcription factor [Micromonospora sp. KC207]|uniref:response regulator transcription factor n=1 Tax=Micromonospora sp. KC207 TaxID=2530377 RepID=UPI001045DB28|nr:response regulator transcription factor [Micromonospora sp. KC207]TDC64736.1 response regulator transcription factor [Micromonospora sp. KC207]